MDDFIPEFSRTEIIILAATVASLRNDLGPDTEISLFGSRARRDHRWDSDYDLLCLIPDTLPRDTDWFGVMDRAEAAASAVVPSAKAHIQIIAESRLEDLYFEYAFLPGAMNDKINVEGILTCLDNPIQATTTKEAA